MLPNLEDLLKGVYLQPMDVFKTMNFTIENNVLPHLNQSGIYNPFDDIDNCFTLTHGDSTMNPGMQISSSGIVIKL